MNMQLDISEQNRRTTEAELKRKSEQLDDLTKRFKATDSECKKLQGEVKHLTPFEPKYKTAEAERVDLKERLHQVEAAYKESKEGIAHLNEAQVVLKAELEKVIATNHDLTEQVKHLSLLKHVREEPYMLQDFNLCCKCCKNTMFRICKIEKSLVFFQDLEEVTVAKYEAEDTIYDLEDRLEMVIASHAATSNKLQLSTLLLQVS